VLVQKKVESKGGRDKTKVITIKRLVIGQEKVRN
jgi:hypothetical protein